MTKVLIIDDDPQICIILSKLLKQMGHDCSIAQTIHEGLECNLHTAFDLVILDLELPDGNGLQILSDLMKSPSEPEVIIITGKGDICGAEMAFKYGAWDYVQKPFLMNEVALPVTRALQYRKEKKAPNAPDSLLRSAIIGKSDAIDKCLGEVARAAITSASVLITGETGTGKELFARAIHENSPRALNPFIAVDCGALPETLVESTLFGHEQGAFTGAHRKQMGLIAQADGGTLLLDEVGDLPLRIQSSFLRTLQERCVRPIGGGTEKPVNFRLVAATNLDLDQMVRKKQFREDLLYRIRAIEIKLPPLREREKDIKELTIKKAGELSLRYGIGIKAISPDFLQGLMLQQWPGNVRELNNVLEYALASAGQDPTLFPKHLPPKYRTGGLVFTQAAMDEPMDSSALPTLQAYRTSREKNYLKRLVNEVQGDRKKACRISGISQSRLYSLLKKHNLSLFRSC
ncbi:MAG: sigma-54 dependent transcriptional regulator [Desulfobacterium sp.]